MRRVLAAVSLLTVALCGSAAAQTGKECAILKRALYGDKLVDGSRSFSDAEVPADLQWPVPVTGRVNLSVGKGNYSFYIDLDDIRAKQLLEALDRQLGQCLPGVPRFVSKGWPGATYCPSGTAKIVNVTSAASKYSPQVILSVNTVTNRPQVCR